MNNLNFTKRKLTGIECHFYHIVGKLAIKRIKYIDVSKKENEFYTSEFFEYFLNYSSYYTQQSFICSDQII